MGFLAPFALSLAALSLPILILYMLKLRRQEQTVSSTMLWQQVLRDRQANSPWQRLRRNILLLLQLLLLFLLVFALARPYSEISAPFHGNIIVLLDASASMQATDVPPSRFQVAQERTSQLIDNLGPADTMTLIAVGDVPRALTSLTHDRSVLRQALSTASVTNTEADWEAAFILASSSARQAANNTTIILSDGGLPSKSPDLPGRVHYVPIGITDENQAISALAVRDGPLGPQAFVRASNRGSRHTAAVLEIYVNGVLFDARTLSLAPASEQGLSLDDLPLDTRYIEARLSEQEQDVLALDNTAYAVRPVSKQARVLLATQGNSFLERAISLLPNHTPVTVRVTQTITSVQISPPFSPELTIYDGVLPTHIPESGSLFFIAPPTSTELFSVTGLLTATEISHIEHGVPLLRYVDLADLHVSNARAIQPPQWAQTLVAAQGGPLLLTGELNGQRTAILAFDLHHSDLPLKIAFPILIANLTNWLAPSSAIDVPPLLGPGQPIALHPQVGAKEISITSPSGQRWTYPVEGNRSISFGQTYELGMYSVEQAGQESPISQAQFAVNLFSELESHIEPQDSLSIGTSSVGRHETATAGRREWWRWLTLVASFLLLVEWAVYWRELLPGRAFVSHSRPRHPAKH